MLRVRIAALNFCMICISIASAGTDRACAGSVEKFLAGPVSARVLRIVDGDTIVVRANIWLGQHIDVAVRLAGIDAPELHSRCTVTRHRAWRARNLLRHLVAGTTVLLHHVRRGKYAGRVIANVHTPDGERVGAMLLAAGLAEPYNPRRSGKRRGATARCSLAARTAMAGSD